MILKDFIQKLQDLSYKLSFEDIQIHCGQQHLENILDLLSLLCFTSLPGFETGLSIGQLNFSKKKSRGKEFGGITRA